MMAKGIIDSVGENKLAPKNVTTEEAIGYANSTRELVLVMEIRMVENFSN